MAEQYKLKYTGEEIDQKLDEVGNIISGGYVEALKELNVGDKFSFWVGTQAEYDALETKPENTLCIVTDDTTADDINAAITALQEQANANSNMLTDHYLQIVDIQSNYAQIKDIDRLENDIDNLSDDYIVEQAIVPSEEGTVQWTYRKWKRGLAECWGRSEHEGVFTANKPNAEIPIYHFSPAPPLYEYPFEFTERPIETMEIMSKDFSLIRYTEGGGLNTTTKTGRYNVGKFHPGDGVTKYTLDCTYHVIGRWKEE